MTNERACANNEDQPQINAHMADIDKLCAAMSILQQQILAMDSILDPDTMFGSQHMPSVSLELALRLMSELLPAFEDERRAR